MGDDKRRLEFPSGEYQLFADDDDVIGLRVATTYPRGYPIIRPVPLVRVDPPESTAFDEIEVGQFLAWCLTNSERLRAEMGV